MPNAFQRGVFASIAIATATASGGCSSCACASASISMQRRREPSEVQISVKPGLRKHSVCGSASEHCSVLGGWGYIISKRFRQRPFPSHILHSIHRKTTSKSNAGNNDGNSGKGISGDAALGFAGSVIGAAPGLVDMFSSFGGRNQVILVQIIHNPVSI